MTLIKISQLRPVGSELFQDSESFLNDLNEKEISTAVGATIDNNNTLLPNCNTFTVSAVCPIIKSPVHPITRPTQQGILTS
ncbi:hypothetical protein [Nostoc sp.]